MITLLAADKALAATLTDPRVRRIHQINVIMVDLGALDMPDTERAALRERLEQLDDVGIALLGKALKGLARRVTTS